MASSFIYNEAARGLLNGEIDINAVTVKAILVMEDTTADTEFDQLDATGFSTLDQFDGTGYSAGGHTLTIAAPAADGTGEGGFASAVVTALTITNMSASGNGTLFGVLLSITSDTPDMPLGFISYAGAAAPDGGNWTMASFKLRVKTT